MSRLAYQAREHLDLHPMEATLNLPRRRIRTGAAPGRDECGESVVRGGGRARRRVQWGELRQAAGEDLAIAAACDFDEFYAQRQCTDEATDDPLAITTEGKCMVVRPEDLRDATEAAAARRTHKLRTRLSPGEKANRKRTAQVAAVYSVPAWPRKSQDIVHAMRRSDVEAKRPKVTTSACGRA